MSKQKDSSFSVTADDLQKYDWQDRLDACPDKQCNYFYGVFADAAKERNAASDDLGHRVFSLLYVVASFHPNYDARGNPYGSMWSGFDGKRSLNAEDLAEADLKALGEILEEIRDPEFRARVADVLWVTKKNYKAARVAVDSFLESAERLKSDDVWPPYAERLDRAARIAGHKGFEDQEKRVVEVIEEAISEFEHNDNSGLLCHRLMSILLWLDAGDRSRYAALSEKLARDFAAAGNWHFSETYWEQASHWHRDANNETEAARCQLEAAECNVSRAEAGLAGNDSSFAYRAHWLGRGFEALRQAKADPKRVEEVHRKLLEMQKKSLSEMSTIEMPPNAIPGLDDAKRNAQLEASSSVRNLPVQDAIIKMAAVTRPVVVKALKEELEKTSQNTIADKIVTTTAVDRFGKVTDILEPAGWENESEEATKFRKRLILNARRVQWPLKVEWLIESARQAILEEHAIRRRDLYFLCVNNPFIPQGHEGIYIRGLQAGFHGDWLVAMHLLVPQVEPSIRYVLNQTGTITTTMRSGIQKERDLNELLPLEAATKIFGEDVIFDLRGILIERFGHNLRNELAHGLIPEGGFYNAAAVYLWWLILHLCLQGFVLAQPESPDAETPPRRSEE